MSSKLWPHHLKGNPATWPIIEAHANEPLSVVRYIKCVDDFGNGKKAKESWPNVRVVGRRNVDYPEGGNLDFSNLKGRMPNDPEGAAVFLFNLTKPYIDLNPFVDYWEFFNEPICEVSVNGVVDRQKTINNFVWLSRASERWMELLDGIGKKGVIGNFNVGSPDIKPNDTWQWDAFLGAMQYANDHGHLCGLHEYADEDPATERSVMLRFRDVINWYCTPHNLVKICFIINEQGTNYWRRRGKQPQVPGWETWYDQQVFNDPRMLAFFPFTFGGDGDWVFFDYGLEMGVTNQICDWIRSQVNVTNPIVIPPVPQVYLAGIDTSHFQEQVNWPVVAQTKAFAITKFGQGFVMDATFERNWKGIKDAGMIRGCFQYMAQFVSGSAQAMVLVNRLLQHIPGDIPPALDVEDTTQFPITISRAELIVLIQAWVDTIKSKLNVLPILYTNQSTWQKFNLPTFGCKLWVANYTDAPNPAMPQGFTEWLFWQHAIAEPGVVSGIPANDRCDLDRFKGTREQLDAIVRSMVISTPPDVVQPVKDKDRVITKQSLNIRVAPDPNSQILGTLPPLTPCVVVRDSVTIASGEQWGNVVADTTPQLYGWVNIRFVKKV